MRLMCTMNKIVLFSLFFTTIFFSAQSDLEKNYIYKAEYFLKFKINTDINTNYQEYFTLYFNDNESLFLSNKIIDIAKVKDVSNGYINMSKFKEKNTIFKEIILSKNNNITSFIKSESQYFSYSQKQAKWNLINEEKKIGNLLCQKATTNFIGRKWIVWYTLAYPVPFGVFKLNGLPGLIVELYDEGSTYHYSLVHIKKFKDSEVIEKIYPKANAKHLSKIDFFKIYDDLLYNKKLLYGQHSSFIKKMFTAEQIRTVKARYEEKKLKRNNFPIDKDLED